MEYNFQEIEKKWQKYWLENKSFHTEIDTAKPKFYVLDMFPYPSGAGLHVGHPLGYIASDIYSRYKRLKGFNVLHPMGYDAYGLPAEQYAIQTGTHPAVTTEKNVARYREQMDKIGFSYDWDREVKTCDPAYYKWTQWTFIRLYNHWYDQNAGKARPVAELINVFKSFGNADVHAAITPNWFHELAKKDSSFGKAWKGVFFASDWASFSEKQQQEILMNYRLAYLSEAMVNWCPELGTVLANDEVANGYSVRGNHAVERKMMRQWFLRITAYSQRLLDGLDKIEWSESLKDQQKYWIGRSEGAEILFPIQNSEFKLNIFTTRPDTIFGSTYMVLSPEHEYIEKITPPSHIEAVRAYIEEVKNRSERERMADVKKISGVFTGTYCLNPFNNKPIPIWVADYVLAGYGTGAIMAVPAHDSRDYDFAKHFGLPIIEVVSGGDISESSYDAKDGILVNSEFINGMIVKEAIKTVINRVSEIGIGKGMVNFRLRDAIFSRQRYWGEPFPVYFKNGIPYVLDDKDLPLELPPVDAYLPTETGEPPLARAKNWKTKEGYPLETNTMPGFAGSSGYYLRYMDPRNQQEYFSKEAVNYWQNVDLYIGGSEHATGHLIYSRFWNKFLFDLGLTVTEEPFKKLVNQGMIQGVSQKIYNVVDDKDPRVSAYLKEFFKNEFKISGFKNVPKSVFISADIVKHEHLEAGCRLINIPIDCVHKERFFNPDNNDYVGHYMIDFHKYAFNLKFIKESDDFLFISNEGLYFNFKCYPPNLTDISFLTETEIEKMSKSKFNVVNPDELIERYGADTFRLYEMFLGPLEQSKPWDTNGIEGVFRFIRKFWRLYHDEENRFRLSDEAPEAAELRILHKTIKKIQEDIERLSFNTAVSTFMICVNELGELKCSKRAILEDLLILISPYAPHLAEELWQQCGHNESITKAVFPAFNETFLVENSFKYPVSFNGKMRFQLDLPVEMPVEEVQKAVLVAYESSKWLEGRNPKKIIVVHKKIINIVV
ncbi:MAG: class I tRNA ligase family protein [Bacteroidetes bacterium]|nr:class I tRNA ligase family protein [Bacteroidota bacterium]